MNTERLGERLRRLEQQLRVFKELHGSELQLIQDELADINAELAMIEATAQSGTSGASAAESTDPAAASPKRAKWLAEQERKAQPFSRRELLRGRNEEG